MHLFDFLKMTTKGMFSVLAVDEEEPQQKTVVQKKVVQAPKPKTEVKPATAKPFKAADYSDFDGVISNEKRVQRGGRGGFRGGRGDRPEGERRGGRGERPEGERRGGFRGGRGDRPEGERGGFRGGFRGGRGERVEGEEGERPTGFSRGRGRGGPRRVEGTEGDEGVLYVQKKEKVDFVGKPDHFEGKHGEKWHPYDRKSGTGRGREVAKGGHGKGNWGNTEDIVKQGEEIPEGSPLKKVELEGETPEGAEETQEAEKETKVETVVEEEPEEKGKTLQEYLASKKKVAIKKEVRQHEAIKGNLEEAKVESNDRVTPLTSSLKNEELYSTGAGKSQDSGLLGFQAPEEDYIPRETRGRGGRGGARGGRGAPRGGARPAQTGGRGARGGQNLRVDEDSFPTLA